MAKLEISRERRFRDLDLQHFDKQRFSVYIIDFQWQYLFVNEFVRENLGEKADTLEGRNMWTAFPELAEDLSFTQMKTDVENGKTINFITTSPLTNKRLNITGYGLKDCYLFYASVLPNKDDLLNELRQTLTRAK